MSKIGMIMADTSRSRVYIQSLINHNLLPNFILLLNNNPKRRMFGQVYKKSNNNIGDIDISIPIIESLNKRRIDYLKLNTFNINDNKVIRIIKKRPELIFIYSGYGGTILKSEIFLTGKKFLHVHGGYLPNYKGSTTNYYSMLNDRTLGASSLFLNEKIDSGPILVRKKFRLPKKLDNMDHFYDSFLRSKVLLKTLKKYSSGQKFNAMETDGNGEIYFIIHPLLKHIAIMSK